MSLSEDKKKWIKETYHRLSELSSEERSAFFEELAVLAKQERGPSLFEDEQKDFEKLCQLVGFKAPEKKI